MISDDVDFLIVDWGTTNFRAFAMSETGALVDKTESGLGLLRVQNGEFAEQLEQVLEGWLGNGYQSLPVLLAGMVGSAQGWKNVPYVDAPADQKVLAKHSETFELPWGARATIIPGVSYKDAEGMMDVMRGEEVQLIGLAELNEGRDFMAALPGTHSKHACFNQGKLTGFSTFMTGELFSVISKNSILGINLPEQVNSQEAFLKGVREAQGTPLTHQLFAARTHRLFNQLQETEVHDFLSGVLIGHELQGVSVEHLFLVGGQTLCERYSVACRELNIPSTFREGNECFLKGMLAIKQELENV